MRIRTGLFLKTRCDQSWRIEDTASRVSFTRQGHTSPTTHNVDKIDSVLSGRFRMTVLGERAVLEAGDCLAIPGDTVHSAEVIGDEPVVSLDATKD